jgi:hypothetical protein
MTFDLNVDCCNYKGGFKDSERISRHGVYNHIQRQTGLDMNDTS